VISPLPPRIDGAERFPYPLYVLAEDANGLVVPSFNATVTMQLKDAGGKLMPGATDAQDARGGVAAFAGDMLAPEANGDRLRFTALTLSQESDPLKVNGL